MSSDPELDVVAYLRDLAERLRKVPVMYGTDGYDIDRLNQIAAAIFMTDPPTWCTFDHEDRS